ncbi:MAG: hypothetical protein MUD01_19580, partial [Chloroflexaceae bacterium]|nr:hypothetical protein [Chloroflexaceae bacterium]
RSGVLLQEQTAALRLADNQRATLTEKLHAATPTAQPRVEQGRLLFTNSTTNVTVHGAVQHELYLARFEAPEPQIQVQGGTIQIRDPRFSIFGKGRGRRNGTITLSTAVMWYIELRGGANACSFDLRELTLSAFAVFDGAFRLELHLGQPRGSVPIRIAGGTADTRIRRPADAATQIIIQNGATRLQFDERYADVLVNETCWQTANYAATNDRYDITVQGGASNLRITR